MTRTAELILENISQYEKGIGQGHKDGQTAITLLGADLIKNPEFRSWVLTGFKAASEHSAGPTAFIAVACNFIRLGYEVAMAELGESNGQ